MPWHASAIRRGRSLARKSAHLAGRNVFLLRTPQAGRLEAVASAEIPAAQSGESDGVKWLAQKIPGDLDWPGLMFAVAMARGGDTIAVAIVTSREAADPRAAAVRLARETAVADAAGLVREHEAARERFWSASAFRSTTRRRKRPGIAACTSCAA